MRDIFSKKSGYNCCAVSFKYYFCITIDGQVVELVDTLL